MYSLKEKEMIFVFTGPDGSGRKTVADMVGATLGIKKVLSYTTRSPRATELEGQDYHFVTEEHFLKADASGEFLETIKLDGHYYGIKHKDVEQMFQMKRFIYLIVNPQGAATLKQIYGDKVTRIFIYSDKETIVDRLQREGASDDIIRKNLAHYDEDMAYRPQCKHAVYNKDLAHTVFAVSNILEQYMNRNLVDKD